MQLTYYANLAFAQEQDRNDPLRAYRDQFYFPQHNGRNALYFPSMRADTNVDPTNREFEQFLEEITTRRSLP